MIPRRLYYAVGVAAMAGLLAAAVFGSVGHMADPYSARSALVGIYLVMLYQRHVCRALMTRQVVGASFVSALLGGAVGRALWHGPITDFLQEAGEVLAGAVFTTALMAASFHCLTLGRGRMP